MINSKEHWKEGKLLCCKCNEYLSHKMFYKTYSLIQRNGYSSTCIYCKDLEASYSKEYKTKRRYIKLRVDCARDRSKKKDLPFDLTWVYIWDLLETQNGMCALSGQEMTFQSGKGKIPTNLSLDRIDPNRGYTMDNIQLLCSNVNSFKNHSNNEEFVDLCKLIVEKQFQENQ